MRMTLAAAAHLKKRIGRYKNGKVGILPGLISHQGMRIEGEKEDISATLKDRILGICGWHTSQIKEMISIDLFGVKVFMSNRTRMDIDKYLIDYIEWADIETGIWQPYLQLRKA